MRAGITTLIGGHAHVPLIQVHVVQSPSEGPGVWAPAPTTAVKSATSASPSAAWRPRRTALRYRLAKRIAISRESLRQRADFVGAHRVLTAAAGMAGDRELSAIALQGLRQAQPSISLEWIARELPMKRLEDRQHYLDGLRRAGLK